MSGALVGPELHRLSHRAVREAVGAGHQYLAGLLGAWQSTEHGAVRLAQTVLAFSAGEIETTVGVLLTVTTNAVTVEYRLDEPLVAERLVRAPAGLLGMDGTRLAAKGNSKLARGAFASDS